MIARDLIIVFRPCQSQSLVRTADKSVRCEYAVSLTESPSF